MASGGTFIAFEGVEGAGKSTQIKLVAVELSKRGVDPVLAREPGGTEIGEAIRELVLDGKVRTSAVTELLLMLAARSSFVADVVRPALEAGRVVLTDRYDLSTLAYQGGGRRIPLATIKTLNEFATGGIRPQLYVLLDVDVDQSLARRPRGAGDRIEKEDVAFHERVARAYRDLAESEPDVALIDGRQEITGVFAVVWAALASRFPETFPPRKG